MLARKRTALSRSKVRILSAASRREKERDALGRRRRDRIPERAEQGLPVFTTPLWPGPPFFQLRFFFFFFKLLVGGAICSSRDKTQLLHSYLQRSVRSVGEMKWSVYSLFFFSTLLKPG